jgi:hypothetical protein
VTMPIELKRWGGSRLDIKARQKEWEQQQLHTSFPPWLSSASAILAPGMDRQVVYIRYGSNQTAAPTFCGCRGTAAPTSPVLPGFCCQQARFPPVRRTRPPRPPALSPLPPSPHRAR